MRYRSLREARGTSQVDARRTRGSRTPCCIVVLLRVLLHLLLRILLCLLLHVLLRLLGVLLGHLLLLLLTRWGGRRRLPPAAAPPPTPTAHHLFCELRSWPIQPSGRRKRLYIGGERHYIQQHTQLGYVSNSRTYVFPSFWHYKQISPK